MRAKAGLLLMAYCLLLTTVLGCESFRKKFVRKKKRIKEVRVVTQTKDYDALYPPEIIYNQYYLFWRAAHDEIIRALYAKDINLKKAIASADEAAEYLGQMQSFLPDHMQSELDPFIDEYADIAKRLSVRSLNRAKRSAVNRILKTQKRQIEQRFSLKHIQEYLVK